MTKRIRSHPVKSSPTWPQDVLRIPKILHRKNADHLICFLACPFDPPERADDLLIFIQAICDELGRSIGADIECVRADKISTPGTIHSDIWKYLELADALIFDVTGGNGNVLLELGVAAACRSQDNVVILRDRDDTKTSKFLFDIAPSRHLLYTRSLVGSTEFRTQFMESLIHALTPAPYKPDPKRKISFPLKISIEQEGDSADLLSPPMLHRRIVADGVEFGSHYFFKNSWITVGDSDYKQIKLRATMRFSDCSPNKQAKAWIGIALRSQHFFANYSHLTYVKTDGSVFYTRPQNELKFDDVLIDRLNGFQLSDFIEFQLTFEPNTLQIRVKNINKPKSKTVSKSINLRSRKDVPHERHAGKIRLQTAWCRAILKKLIVYRAQ